MTMHRLKKVLVAVFVTTGALVGSVATTQATTLDSILEVGKSKNDAARKSQVKIDRLADETRDLLSDYKIVVKQVDGLKVYNSRLERQIDNWCRPAGRDCATRGVLDRYTAERTLQQIVQLLPEAVAGSVHQVAKNLQNRGPKQMANTDVAGSNVEQIL